MLHILMDLMAGGDLTSLGRVPEAGAKIIVKELLTAIAFMHSKNIIYRDLKPQVIVLVSLSSLC